LVEEVRKTGKKRRIYVCGDKIRADRKAKRWSVDQLARECNVSYDVIQDAENGLCTSANTELIASILAQPGARYLTKNSELSSSTQFALEGDWDVLYLEKEMGAPPYLVRDTLKIWQSDGIIGGRFFPDVTDNPDGFNGTLQFELHGKIEGDFIFGTYLPDFNDQKYPQGSGTFQLKIMRHSMWLEGFLTFYSDTGSISLSHTIWLKRRSVEYASLIKVAERVFREKPIFQEAPIIW
jgi:transcriptional regulator with XRE-family HTH domain